MPVDKILVFLKEKKQLNEAEALNKIIDCRKELESFFTFGKISGYSSPNEVFLRNLDIDFEEIFEVQ